MACRDSFNVADVRNTAPEQNNLISALPTGTVLNSVPAIPIRRRGKSMSRRVGQNGEVFVKQLCKKGGCAHPKGFCPKYGRYWKDVPGQHTRQRLCVSFGKVTWTVAERKLREHILATGVDSVETFNEVTGPLTTFREQADWWLKEIRSGSCRTEFISIRLNPSVSFSATRAADAACAHSFIPSIPREWSTAPAAS